MSAEHDEGRDDRARARFGARRAAHGRHGQGDPRVRRRRAARLHLETLETRMVPATISVMSAADDPTMVLDSLRSAITSIDQGSDANPAITAARTGAYRSSDRIEFDIARTGVQTIAVATPLPLIDHPMTIDGYTQPGAQVNTLFTGGTNAKLLIELHGPDLGVSSPNGLTITAADCKILGLVIDGFNAGVLLFGAGCQGTVVAGDFIGTDPSGSAASAPNQNGVYLIGGPSANTVGGAAPAERNLISGNATQVELQDIGTSNNVVLGNMIGTDATGSRRLASFDEGVIIEAGASSNTIGGTAPGASNLISAGGACVAIEGTGADHNVVSGNLIGTNADGSAGVHDSAGRSGIVGVSISSGAIGNLVGGTTPGARNVISGDNYGVIVQGSTSNRNVVSGNYIGTNAAGTAAVPNQVGVSVVDAGDDTFGGLTPGAGNLISGNFLGIEFKFPGARYNRVEGNLIGTDATGLAILPNQIGVSFSEGASSNTVGGSAPGARNVISGNAVCGVMITAFGITTFGTSINVVAGNAIGVSRGGLVPLPNGVGVALYQGATDNIIGGTSLALANTIAYNTKGVVVGTSPTDTSPVRNRILGNSLFNNTVMGIDLGNDGPTPNGVNPRAFANDGQNTPVIASVVGTTVTGTLQSAPNALYRIEFFSTPANVPLQGRYLGRSVVVKTDSHGHASFTGQIGVVIPYGARLTATATNLTTHDTSEFSAAAAPAVVISPATLPALTVHAPFQTTETASGGGLGAFTFSIASGVLPAGLTLDAATGVLRGTPTKAGPYDFIVRATESQGETGTRRYHGAVAAAPAGPAPTVVSLRRFGVHAQPTALALTFSTALDPARAQDVRNYSLFVLDTKHRRFDPIPLASAVYDPGHFRVTLTPARRLDVHARYLLEIHGKAPRGLATPTGVPLDGLGHGHPGSDFARVFGPEVLAGPNRLSS